MCAYDEITQLHKMTSLRCPCIALEHTIFVRRTHLERRK
jgi:hypothetical protein